MRISYIVTFELNSNVKVEGREGDIEIAATSPIVRDAGIKAEQLLKGIKSTIGSCSLEVVKVRPTAQR